MGLIRDFIDSTNHLARGLFAMSEATDRLAASVEHITSVADSAVALIGTLAQEIRDSIGNDDALNALADSLDAESSELAEAVTANTPAADPAPVDEPGIDTPPVAAGNGDPASGSDED